MNTPQRNSLWKERGVGAVILAVSLLVGLTVSQGPVESASFDVPQLVKVTYTVPDGPVADEFSTTCLMRFDPTGFVNAGEELVFEEGQCYTNLGATLPPPPPPPYNPPTSAFVLPWNYNAATGDMTTSRELICGEVVEGVLAFGFEFDVSLSKTGGNSTGTATLVTDAAAPFDCLSGTESVGAVTMSPLLLSHDEDSDGCTDDAELDGITDPFNPFDCTTWVSDVLVGSLNSGAGLFYCITKTQHATSTNEIRTYSQCNIDIENAGIAPTTNTPPTWEDTCAALAARPTPECVAGQLRNPSEPGPDGLAGPPPPPPFTIYAPSEGEGTYYASGGPGCGASACTVVTTCFRTAGPVKGPGPNIIWTATILNPKVGATVQADADGHTVKDTQVDRVSSGTVDIWYNQNKASCDAGTPKGAPNFAGLPLESIQVNDKGGTNVNGNPAPWRPGSKPGATVIDFDGDNCTDEAELAKFTRFNCGDDPQNPSDSFADAGTADLSGVYDILVTVERGDCTSAQCTTEAPGKYFFCRTDLQHDTNNDLEVRAYCYWDSTASEINPEAFPGIVGDGMTGAPPPGPQSGSGNYTFGDVDLTHAELSGTFDRLFANLLEISGCIEDQDGAADEGNVYVDLTVSAHQVPGTTDIWTNQTLANCQNGTPVGAATFPQAELSMVQANPNKGKGYDQDNDGVPTAAELQDDTACGRRDPYNKNDYYDVSIPRDGVIDLANDILGTIVHFSPGGYPAGDENWDRPPAMIGRGAGSNWNRGSPDGVIDLANDILGVILQFNPGGCPAQQ